MYKIIFENYVLFIKICFIIVKLIGKVMRYKKPSIIEALCEFRFVPGSEPWDITIFGDFKSKVSSKLNGERETLDKIGVQVITKEDKTLPQVSRIPQMRFWSGDKTKLAQISKNLLTANVLHPYPGWKDFKDFILWTFDQYKKITKSSEIERLLLRYIDRLNLPAEDFKIGEWMDCEGEYLPSSLKDIDNLLNYRFLRPINDNKHLGFTIKLIPSSKEERNLTIDTEAICDAPSDNLDSLSGILDYLHDQINVTFEGSITDKFREFLEPLEE